jgi:hypothetical protein
MMIIFQLKQLIQSYVPTSFWNTKAKATKTHIEEPRTLLELLQRAARLWPNHGIAFKDQGWDQSSNFMTYADLLRESEVRLPTTR